MEPGRREEEEEEEEEQGEEEKEDQPQLALIQNVMEGSLNQLCPDWGIFVERVLAHSEVPGSTRGPPSALRISDVRDGFRSRCATWEAWPGRGAVRALWASSSRRSFLIWGLDSSWSQREGPESAACNLKASLHYTVGSMCQEAADAKGVRFTKSTIAAISEVTFRQCEHFARDLELFARHAKRSTINMEDVKLLARRSSSLLNYITEKSEEISRVNQEQKDKKKKKAEGGSKKSSKQAVTKMDIDD
ncbi:centromere protein S isoform X1 [Notamacropus eugenii]|uniref:centromere protein S isoform X1 n=1 Tax=Notamacropus eugenii TaxID=9315 RepID=UPI003B6809C6